jgi:hypothetical protein
MPVDFATDVHLKDLAVINKLQCDVWSRYGSVLANNLSLQTEADGLLSVTEKAVEQDDVSE